MGVNKKGWWCCCPHAHLRVVLSDGLSILTAGSKEGGGGSYSCVPFRSSVPLIIALQRSKRKQQYIAVFTARVIVTTSNTTQMNRRRGGGYTLQTAHHPPPPTG